MSEGVDFVLDGQAVSAAAGETILQAAQRHGREIPHLCWTPGLKAVGNCRACMVEVQGERTLAAACCRQPTPGLQVSSRSARALAAQTLVLELLQADLPAQAHARHNEVNAWAQKLGLGRPRFAPRPRCQQT